MRYHIITPLSRPENLPALSDNVEKECSQYLERSGSYSDKLYWHIVVDASLQDIKIPYFVKPSVNIFYHQAESHNVKNASGGHLLRNIALEDIYRIEKPLTENVSMVSGVVYNLDDDNLLFPDFFNTLSGMIDTSINPEISVFTWPQVTNTGGFRLPAPSGIEDMTVGRIDTAMYAFDTRFVTKHNIRYDDDYCGDGLLAQKFMSLEPNSLRSYNTVNCWYNKLRPL